MRDHRANPKLQPSTGHAASDFERAAECHTGTDSGRADNSAGDARTDP